jgi:hypothetical protein
MFHSLRVSAAGFFPRWLKDKQPKIICQIASSFARENMGKKISVSPMDTWQTRAPVSVFPQV